MFPQLHLSRCVYVVFLLSFTCAIAQEDIQYIFYDSTRAIGFIDRSIEDSEVESYDIVVINSLIKDTTILCRNALYIDSYSVKLTGSQLYYISHEYLVAYNIETAVCDTVFRNTDGLNINAFCLISNILIAASVNNQTEEITFSVLNLTFNKILWSCIIYEPNVGLEYLRIIMREAGADNIDVLTNQYNYSISIRDKTCRRKN